MYSYIKGELVEISEDAIVVENNGIGYNIRIPRSILGSLQGIGQEIKIYTYTYVREDAMLLYGFLSRDDRKVFELLLGVSGIGPKGALAILSVLTPDELRFAILSGDDKTIATAPGIGKKSAQRLIIELKDKLSLEEAFELKSEHVRAASDGQADLAKNEAMQALVALGYTAAEAMRAVDGADVSPDSTTEEILKAALRNMVI